MDKWEYLTCTPSGIFTTIDSNIPVGHFAAAFPSQKVTCPRKGIISIEWKGKADEAQAFSNTILQCLGDEGWEAYHVDSATYYFKRKG